MNNSINYAGFTEMFTESNEDYEPYGCVDAGESIERIYNNIQSYKAGFGDREYSFDD
jgi:hypothetical protein